MIGLLVDYLVQYKGNVQQVVVVLFLMVALLQGRAPERLICAVFAAWIPFDICYHMLAGGSIMLRTVNVGHFLLDTVLLVDFVVIALYANRLYPLWIAGAQLVAIFAHLLSLLPTHSVRFAYDMMALAPSYIQLTTLGLGLASQILREHQGNDVRDWRAPRGNPPSGALV